MELYEGIPLSDHIYYAPQMFGMRLGWFMIGCMTLMQYDVRILFDHWRILN